MKHLLTIILAAHLSVFAHAQITGIITDSKTGKPLTGVEVFINKTATAALSDQAGQFKLENVLTGFPEIVLYKKGYSMYRSSMKIQAGRAYNLKLSLTAAKKKKAVKLTEQERAELKKDLMGQEANAVTVDNEDDIGVVTDEDHRVFSAKSPLIIENETTGYRLKYYLTELPLHEVAQAPVQYGLLTPNDMQQTITWDKDRKNYFQGSVRHWLMALVAGQPKEEGYSMKDEKGDEVDMNTLLSTSSLAGYSKLDIGKPITIVYKRENGSIETSHVVTNSPVNVDAAGILITPKALAMTGHMANVSLADQLPIDYQPIAGDVEAAYAQTMERFYEKIYVHTDKPYYYPGEPMWFKGYIHYKEPAWRDSLSKVVYVELINPKKEITLTKALKIDSGFFHNDFILPDTLKEGTYYLRAYTNLNRNFGDSTLFVKPIPILNITDKVDRTQGKMEATENSLLAITSDKKVYKTRERITLTLIVKGKEGNPLAASLSVSVTDAVQVVPIAEPITILNSYPFEKEKQIKATELKYPVEYGVGFRGKFVNDKGKPEKATLTILQMKPRNMMLAETDGQGFFSTTGFDFYDSATFSFKADKAKDYPYGKVGLLPRGFAPMGFKTGNVNLSVQNTQSQQRIISEYEVSRDTRLLEAVEIKGRRIEEPVDRVQRPYGKADFILTEELIDDKGYGNLVYSLVGKVAGLIVVPESRSIGFSRAGGQSINFGGGPLVTIDDVPMGGSAYDVISAINPSSVKSIEITRRINVLYGSLGANGVIGIYLKQGISDEDFNIAPNFQLLRIQGYSPSRLFRYPDYGDPRTDTTSADYRSTIYWNPEIVTDSKTGTATVSFYAADLPGRYRVVAEGVARNGEPVRCVYFVEVVD